MDDFLLESDDNDDYDDEDDDNGNDIEDEEEEQDIDIKNEHQEPIEKEDVDVIIDDTPKTKGKKRGFDEVSQEMKMKTDPPTKKRKISSEPKSPNTYFPMRQIQPPSNSISVTPSFFGAQCHGNYCIDTKILDPFTSAQCKVCFFKFCKQCVSTMYTNPEFNSKTDAIKILCEGCQIYKGLFD